MVKSAKIAIIATSTTVGVGGITAAAVMASDSGEGASSGGLSGEEKNLAEDSKLLGDHSSLRRDSEESLHHSSTEDPVPSSGHSRVSEPAAPVKDVNGEKKGERTPGPASAAHSAPKPATPSGPKPSPGPGPAKPAAPNAPQARPTSTSGGGGTGKSPVSQGKPQPTRASNSSHLEMRDANDKALYATANKQSLPFKRDSGFNLGIYRCAKAFFPGARMPNLNAKPIEESVNDSFDAAKELLKGPSSSAVKGKALGCSLMSFQWEKGQFLIKSELALKNDLLGLAYWVGVKDTHNHSASVYRPHIVHHLAFFEKEGKV